MVHVFPRFFPSGMVATEQLMDKILDFEDDIFKNFLITLLL
jgi:hypothetical protein